MLIYHYKLHQQYYTAGIYGKSRRHGQKLQWKILKVVEIYHRRQWKITEQTAEMEKYHANIALYTADKKSKHWLSYMHRKFVFCEVISF